MPAKKPTSRTNGRMLTVKHLDRRSYNAIHRLPRGLRGPTMKALLKLLADWMDYKKGIPATDAVKILQGEATIVETV